MRSKMAFVFAAAILILACARKDAAPGTGEQETAAAGKTPTLGASLECEGGTFSVIRLTNTRARSYQRDSFSDRCELTDQAAGVIWVATGEGHALVDAAERLLFKDERDRPLDDTCWTRSGTINGLAQTEVILFGPEDSTSITVCCGDACAAGVLEEAAHV